MEKGTKVEAESSDSDSCSEVKPTKKKITRKFSNTKESLLDAINSTERDIPEEYSKQAISRCIYVLKRARNEAEKFAALLMITKMIKADGIDDKCKSRLFDAIGMDFLLQLLRDDPPDEMCPKYMLKSIALTVLCCFINTTQKKDVFYGIVPDLLRIITDPELYDDNLTIIRDACQCLLTIALNSGGRKAIIEDNGMQILVDLYIQENFCQDIILEILKIIMNSEGENAWIEDRESFSKLAQHVCKEFSQIHSERKFELCSALTEMMFSMPDLLPGDDGYEWQKQLHKGLSDILLSKLGKQQRELGLKLACASLSSLGATWVVSGGSRGHQLLLIMVHLSCIEVRMSLENETFEKAIELAPHTTGCYTILENAIKFLVEGAFNLEEKQKQHLYTALKGAFNAVLSFLKDLSDEKVHTSNMPTQLFVCATIRVLGAWLAEETAANKAEVYNILPFVMRMCLYNFNHNKKNKEAAAISKLLPGRVELPDLLKFLLPGLCHLTAEDEPRLILLNLDVDKFLFDYLKTKFDSLKLAKESKNLSSGSYSNEAGQLTGIMDSITTLCSIFMNIVVTSSPDIVMKNLYLTLLRYIFVRVPELSSKDDTFLALSGNLCILGLMILKHQHVNVKNTEFGIFRFIQGTVRFLWDAHNIEDSLDYTSLVVSHKYHLIWDQLMELWYLGMHNLTILVSMIPWLCDFLLECDWPQSLVKSLADTRTDGIESSLKSTFEDLLAALVETSALAKKTLRDEGVENVARLHDMNGLLTALQS